MKVQITMDDVLARKLDDFANRNYTSRSGVVSLAVSQYLQADEVRQAIVCLSVAAQKIADTGTVDEDTLRQINDLAITCKVLSGQTARGV